MFTLLPVLPRSHQSGEVGMASFCRVDSLAGRLPSMLSALEEHDFLFQLHLNDMPQDDSNEVQTCLCALHTICYTVFISDFIHGEVASCASFEKETFYSQSDKIL